MGEFASGTDGEGETTSSVDGLFFEDLVGTCFGEGDGAGDVGGVTVAAAWRIFLEGNGSRTSVFL